jgi:hypothetical protein
VRRAYGLGDSVGEGDGLDVPDSVGDGEGVVSGDGLELSVVSGEATADSVGVGVGQSVIAGLADGSTASAVSLCEGSTGSVVGLGVTHGEGDSVVSEVGAASVGDAVGSGDGVGDSVVPSGDVSTSTSFFRVVSNGLPTRRISSSTTPHSCCTSPLN